MVPGTMQVQGMLDASSLVDVRPTGWPFSNDLIPLQALIAELVTAISPTFAPTCAAKYHGAAAWKCLLGCVAVLPLRAPALLLRLRRARAARAAQAVPHAAAGDALLRQRPAD
jgi:hypothetical protein